MEINFYTLIDKNIRDVIGWVNSNVPLFKQAWREDYDVIINILIYEVILQHEQDNCMT